MEQRERREYMIKYLLRERHGKGIAIPQDGKEQRRLLRALLNVREAKPADEDFIKIQNEYLQKIAISKGIITLDNPEVEAFNEGLYLWQGDITRLEVGAIVNAANSDMTGCYRPNHNCIDNCIHTFGGFQIRLDCDALMQKQGYKEPVGQAKITKAYNLPSKYILHTVGPIVYGDLTEREEELLASCYKSCLELSEKVQIDSVAFCCISTGVFMFPQERAAEIAVQTTRKYKQKNNSDIKVLFNVFKDTDYEIYKSILKGNRNTDK